MHILGNTLPKIAYQKAGIIKKNSKTVIFKQLPDVDDVFKKECEKKNNKLYIVKESDISNYTFDNELQYFDYKDIKNLVIKLKGKVQVKNAALCIETIKILNELGHTVSIENIKKGLETVVHKGRMEQLCNNPVIVYDGAHNEPAMQKLQDMVQMYYSNYKRTYIISILKSKDYVKMLRIISQDKDATYVLTSGNDADRYVTSDELYECMTEYVKNDKVYKKSLEDAVTDAMNSKPNTVNLIIGSFYTYGTVVSKINEIKNHKSIDKII